MISLKQKYLWFCYVAVAQGYTTNKTILSFMKKEIQSRQFQDFHINGYMNTLVKKGYIKKDTVGPSNTYSILKDISLQVELVL